MKWSEQLRFREKVHERYPDLWHLPVVRKRLPFVLKHLKDGESVLEIGAFNRELGDRIKGSCPRITYKSLDIDPSFPHDYASFEEITERFDVVLLFEVIEHLDLEEGRRLVKRIFDVLRPGGRVVLTTPNVYAPGQYWKDVSHRTAYHYEELGGLFLSQRFELIEICRLFNEPAVPYFMKACVVFPLFRFLGIDFSKSLLLAARKGAEEREEGQEETK